MKTKKSIVFGAVILILLGGVFFSIKHHQEKSASIQGEKTELESLIDRLEEFDVKREDLSEEAKEAYFQRFQRQRQALRKALEFVDENNEASLAALYWPVYYLGNIHRDIGDYKKAEDAYLFAHKIQPNAFPPLGSLGELYFRYFRDYERALEYYLQAIERISPGSGHVETYYSDVYEIYRFHLKDDKAAEEILLSGAERFPEKTDILADLALFYRQTGRLKEARETYEKILRINPESIAAKEGLEKVEEDMREALQQEVQDQ